MLEHFKMAWGELLQPMLQRPKRLQVAALCYRSDARGKRVLLITSRDTGRWILPKGWPMVGKNSPEAAMQEAWEEAGVRKGRSASQPVGTYTYEKQLPSGWAIPVETLVYPVEVEEMSDEFPEAAERRRQWLTPREAAGRVREPELQAILRDF